MTDQKNQTITDPGTYLELDGRPAVRFERRYPHPVEKVWAAVSDPEQLSRWFPSQVDYDPKPGGRIRFEGDPNLESSEGTVLAYQPPRLLAFTWGPDELRLELEPVDGGCRFRLVNLLGERDAAARNATGWTVCVLVLGRLLDGQDVEGPHADDVPPFRPLYDSYVEAGMPHGAPVPAST